MNEETINFILGWLAGIFPSLLTIFIGYRLQLKSDERRRKTDVINRRLDQAENFADSILELAFELDRFTRNGLEKNRSRNIKALEGKLENKTLASSRSTNIFLILQDRKLGALEIEYRSLLSTQVELLKKVASKRNAGKEDKEDYQKRRTKLLNSFKNWHAGIKRRIDYMRTLDPIEYFRKS